MNLYDAHNHLQDERLAPWLADVHAACVQAGISGMVVNGTHEDDWSRVLDLSRLYPEVIPSLGLHPWWVPQRSARWLESLGELVRGGGRCAIGEIGLDRWKPDLPYQGQEDVFLAQLQLAAELNRPVSIHCLKAWSRLLELLETHASPACGFLLHSYAGGAELIEPLARLGGYFSLPGAFLREQKDRAWALIHAIPPDRLLLETDAPDQALPSARVRYSLPSRLNHPANLAVVYEAAAETLKLPVEALAVQLAHNVHRLFGGMS